MPDPPALVDTRGQRITERQLRRGFRYHIISGSLAQVWLATCGLPLIMFFDRLGASNQTINHISSLGLLAMLAQIPAALIGERLSRRKHFWFFCSLPHRLLWMFPAVVAYGLAGPADWAAPATLVMIGVSNCLAQMGSPPWQSWMADLIPEQIRGRFWGRRQAVGMSALLATLPAVGWLLDVFKGEFIGFAVIFAFGALAGCVDVAIHAFGVPEPTAAPLPRDKPLWRRVFAPLKLRDFRWLTLAMAFWQFSLGIIGGLSAVYLRRYYHASFIDLSLTSVAAAFGSVASGFLGAYLIDRIGARAYGMAMMFLMVFSMLSWYFLFDREVVVALPGLPAWRTSQPLALIILASVGTGMAGSGMLLTQMSLLGEHAPREGRTMAMAVHWTAVGLMGGVGPWIGGVYADWIEAVGPIWTWPGEMLPVGTRFGFMQALAFMQAVVALGAALPALLMVRGRGKELPLGEALLRLVFFNPVRFAGSVYNIYALGSAPDRKDRARAARKLASLRTHIAASDLIRHLDDPSPDVREAATFALSKLGGPDAVEALIAKIDDPGSDLASHAIRALREIGDVGAVPAIIRKIGDGDREVRTQAVRALGRMGDRRAIAPLLGLLRSTDDPKTFVSTAEALANLQGTGALPDLLDYLRKTPDSVRKRSVAIAAGDLAGGERGRFYRGLAEEGGSRGIMASRWLKTCLRAAHAGLLLSDGGAADDSGEAPDGATGRLEEPERAAADFEDAYEFGRLEAAARLLPALAELATIPLPGMDDGARRHACREYLARLAAPRPDDVPADEVEVLLGLFLATTMAAPPAEG